MIVQREVKNIELAQVLKDIDEKELLYALNLFIKKKTPKLIKVGDQKPFKPFMAVKMKGEGPTASEMVIQDRS